MIRNIIKLPVVLTLFFIAVMFTIAITFSETKLLIPFSTPISHFLYITGILIIAIGGYTFRKKQTTVNPMTPDKATSLVTTGIYKYTRNPMYIGYFLWLLASFIYTGHVLNLILLPLFVVIVNKLYITPEEGALTKIFGSDFLEYKDSVRRWI